MSERCPYDNPDCPAPGARMGAGHHATCVRRLERLAREERPNVTVTADTRPQVTPENLYDDLRDAIRALADWMESEGFDEQETRDWLHDVVGDARHEALGGLR